MCLQDQDNLASTPTDEQLELPLCRPSSSSPLVTFAEVLASQIKEEAAPGLRALASIEPAFPVPPSHDVTVTRRRPRNAWRTRGAFAQPPRRRVSALRRWQLHRGKSHCWNSAHSGGHLPGQEGWSHSTLHAQDARHLHVHLPCSVLVRRLPEVGALLIVERDHRVWRGTPSVCCGLHDCVGDCHVTRDNRMAW